MIRFVKMNKFKYIGIEPHIISGDEMKDVEAFVESGSIVIYAEDEEALRDELGLDDKIEVVITERD